MVTRKGKLLGAGCFSAGIDPDGIARHNDLAIKDGKKEQSPEGTWTLYHGPCEDNEFGWYRSVYTNPGGCR